MRKLTSPHSDEDDGSISSIARSGRSWGDARHDTIGHSGPHDRGRLFVVAISEFVVCVVRPGVAEGR